jgi:hypothetical protein
MTVQPCQEHIELNELRVEHAERMLLDGEQAVELTFDTTFSERLRQFTNETVGCRVLLLSGGQILGRLRIREPIIGGRAKLTGDLGDAMFEALSVRAVIDLRIE